MTRPERRQAPRMAVEGLAYVNLGADNGGIVLNISEGGLCFHSTIPVQQTATIRFWFAQRYPRIEGQWTSTSDSQAPRDSAQFIKADSELSWTDETRKIGGLRFTNMPPEAREQIRNWISHHTSQIKMEGKPSSAPPPPAKPTLRRATLQDINNMRRGSFAFPKYSENTLAPGRLPGFSGGLVAGVAVSALVASAFLLATHTGELGSSLIRLGERIGGRTIAESATPKQQAASPESLPEPLPKPLSERLVQVPTAVPASQQKNAISEPPVSIERPRELRLGPLAPEASVSRTVYAVPQPAPAKFSNRGAGPPIVPRASLPVITVPPLDTASNILSVAAPKTESPSKPNIEIEGSKDLGTRSTLERYLEVGKFNDKLWSNQATERLSLLGYHPTVIQKGAFWKKSFHVLVGPYSTDQEAEAAHKSLTSKGFAPRSFERGTKEFKLPLGLRADGAFIPGGYCIIHWESYMPDAFVRFEDYRGMTVAVEGKWVKRDGRHDQNATVYRKNVDGSRTLLELHFSGREQVLVFGKESI